LRLARALPSRDLIGYDSLIEDTSTETVIFTDASKRTSTGSNFWRSQSAKKTVTKIPFQELRFRQYLIVIMREHYQLL
jgi:hypothetical protein